MKAVTSFILVSTGVVLLIKSMFGFVGQIEKDPVLTANETIEELFMSLESMTDDGDFESAIKFLQAVDIDSVFKKTFSEKKSTEVKKLFFLAYAEEAILIPGIPDELEAAVWKQRNFVEIPGTGDDLRIKNRVLRQRWFDAVANFELKFNARVYRYGVSLGKFPSKDFTADEARRLLHIDQQTWKQLPVEIQVTLEILVGKEILKQAEVDALPSTPQHDHPGKEE